METGVTVPTLHPVFPKTCPGCDRPSDASDLVSGTERGRAFFFALIGRAHLAWIGSHAVEVPMCRKCAGYRVRRVIPLLSAGFLIVCLATAYVGLKTERASYHGKTPTAEERFLRSLQEEHNPRRTERGQKSGKLWLIVPPVLFLTLAVTLDRKRPCRITDVGRDPFSFLTFVARSPRWLKELQKLNVKRDSHRGERASDGS